LIALLNDIPHDPGKVVPDVQCFSGAPVGS
jgi:hypothetical protein